MLVVCKDRQVMGRSLCLQDSTGIAANLTRGVLIVCLVMQLVSLSRTQCLANLLALLVCVTGMSLVLIREWCMAWLSWIRCLGALGVRCRASA